VHVPPRGRCGARGTKDGIDNGQIRVARPSDEVQTGPLFVHAVYREYFSTNLPARYCIWSDLIRPEILVEISSVASSVAYAMPLVNRDAQRVRHAAPGARRGAVLLRCAQQRGHFASR